MPCTDVNRTSRKGNEVSVRVTAAASRSLTNESADRRPGGLEGLLVLGRVLFLAGDPQDLQFPTLLAQQGQQRAHLLQALPILLAQVHFPSASSLRSTDLSRERTDSRTLTASVSVSVPLALLGDETDVEIGLVIMSRDQRADGFQELAVLRGGRLGCRGDRLSLMEVITQSSLPMRVPCGIS
jgi:hypothetical protein